MTMGPFDAVLLPHRQARFPYRMTTSSATGENVVMATLTERIQSRLEAIGLSARAASLKAGLSADAIRNVQRGGSSSPRFETISALARALECNTMYLTGEADEPGEAAPEVGGEFQLPVLFTVAAGAWRENDDHNQDHPRMAPAQRLPPYDAWPQWLEEVEGDSMNRMIPPGSLVHVVDTRAMGYEARHGDLVVVLRTRAGGFFQERTIKQVELTPHSVELWPRSYNEKWSTPLEVSNGAKDDETATVAIVGKVVRAYIGFGD